MVCRSKSGTALVRSPSGTALSCKKKKGALIVLLARNILGLHRLDSWLEDRQGLENRYAARDPDLNVLVRIMWLTKNTVFQGASDNYNTHQPIFFFDSTGTRQDVLPPKWIHDPAVDVNISDGQHDPPLPVVEKKRMEVFDDELILVDQIYDGECPSANDTRPESCRSLYPPTEAWTVAVEEFQDEFGFEPSFISIVAPLNLFNAYERSGQIIGLERGIGTMGMQDQGLRGTARIDRFETDPSGQPVAVPSHLYRRDVLASTVRAWEDRGIDVHLSEYGEHPQDVFTGESVEDRVYFEVSKRLEYVNQLSLEGKL